MSLQILLIDDNPTNLKLAMVVLQMEGHVVVPAMHAEQALQILEQLVPDLILMDIALPGMDGFALAHEEVNGLKDFHG